VRILIVEDDPRISNPLTEDLLNQNYSVDVAHDGKQALALSEQANYDLVLLDVMLPEIDGIEVCRSLRHRGYAGAVLMLTARMSKTDKVVGLDSGADDYLVKPFDVDELNARIRALLRRGNNIGQLVVRCGKLAADLRLCTTKYNSISLALTPTEHRILIHLMRHPDCVFSKNQLIETAWVDAEAPTEATVKAHIKALRNKLQKAGAPWDIIQTVYGFGYRLNAGHS
jgi:DNA-binding response OmpR family regulator